MVSGNVVNLPASFNKSVSTDFYLKSVNSALSQCKDTWLDGVTVNFSWLKLKLKQY